jgi:hypothetical protein
LTQSLRSTARFVAVVGLSVVQWGLSPLWAQSRVPLQEGTRIRLEVLDELSSNKSRVGQEVRLRVRDNVFAGDKLVIRQGAKGTGQVTLAKGSGGLGRNGKLEFIINVVEAVDGTKVPLRNEQEVKGRKRTAAVAAAAVLVTPLALFIKGRNATIEAGTVFETYVNQTVPIESRETVEVPAPTASAETGTTTTSPIAALDEAPTASVSAVASPVTDAQTFVVALTGGRSEEGVLTAIRDNQVNLTTDIGELRIDAAKVTSITAQEGPGTPQTMLVKLRNGKEVQGTLASYQNGAYTLQSPIGTLTMKKENVLSLSVAPVPSATE